MKKRAAATMVLVLGSIGVATGVFVGPSLSSAAVSPPPPTIDASQAQQIALTRAASAGDANPSVAVVDEPLGQAAAGIGSPQGAALAASETPVYLVSMHGNFTLDRARIPKGFKSPTGNALQVIVDHTGFVLGLHLGTE
jgi:hypothetical protein